MELSLLQRALKGGAVPSWRVQARRRLLVTSASMEVLSEEPPSRLPGREVVSAAACFSTETARFRTQLTSGF